jgi:CBS domain-containing protein
MQRNVVCLSEDVPIARATAALIEGGFSGAPVVDLESRPIGIISLTDLVRQQHAADNEQPSSSHRSKVVGDWMTPIVCSIPESSDIGRAAAVMAFEGIHRVPVTSNERRVVGIVSALDIMRALAHAAGFVVPKGPAPRQPKSDSQQR